MLQTLGPAPGIEATQAHTIEISASDTVWQVHAAGLLLAESADALVLRETNYAPVVYFPASAVRFSKLAKADIKTNCPFKGVANYFRLATEPRGDVVAWTYPNTYDDVAEIRGHVAFYADRVECDRNR